ncbi:hypothetical protein OIU80_04215 [Flavobacterium sp. LS1R47]|uniref:Uncharacterized protein n=1 Tax=Flavobacterium frigoritolerans TaxID=2987686 RepID=A0A9X2ZMW5_9FLAO|nr:hypothetical protein [Flavobacterium frigoritolerans]MCV9931476.1 hypothetical protein [Flavobacterium frigoritolerans]
MRNFLLNTLVLFFVTSFSFVQAQTIEKGSYLSKDNDQGLNLKLNLLENNKYELVFLEGDYEVKNDSLLLKGKNRDGVIFNVDYAYDTPVSVGKIKVKFMESLYYGFYIGTQNGTDPVKYQRISDIQLVDDETADSGLNFEIDHEQFLYLVYEGYSSGTPSKILKFAVPDKATEVTIEYQPYSDNPELKGFFDKKTNELTVFEISGKNPLIFQNAKLLNQELVKTKLLPLESKNIKDWTYPGKDEGITVDGVAPEVYDVAPRVDFKLKVESSLADAIKVTKAADNKFLIVYNDIDNKSAQAYFDAFIISQQEAIGYNFYEAYDPKYDVYNYYLTNKNDKSWLKKNNMSDSPSIIILDGNDTILATAKSNLVDKQYQFTYYDVLYIKLKKASALADFSKVITNKKASDADLIKAFNAVSVFVGISDDYYSDEPVEGDFKFAKSTLDKKQVQSVWEKIIIAHQKDTKPNMMLVESILAEIKSAGLNKVIFKTDKVLNDTDFKSIDYLLKHYDAIEAQSQEYNAKDDTRVAIGDISSEISSTLQNNAILYADGGVVEKSDEKRVMETYRKLISGGKGNFESYRSYFSYLAANAANGDPDNLYLKEFDAYFNKMLVTQENVIQRLDEMYSADVSTSYYGWREFKEYHTNLCNDVAWFTVLHSTDAAFIKKAIKWSEYSLVVKKNDPYYLDTLAQLYYKDGQKDKAIKTQQLAVQFFKDVEEETKIEIQETLVKMQNGTY